MPSSNQTHTSNIEQVARDIEVLSMAYSRSLNAMNNLIQMQIQDILDVSLEVRRELIEMEELEEYLEHSEIDMEDFDDDMVEMDEDAPADIDEEDDHDKAHAKHKKNINKITAAQNDVQAVAKAAKSTAAESAGESQTDPVASLVNAVTVNLAKAMENTLRMQEELNVVATAALTDGLALIYGYDDEDFIDNGN